MYPTKLIHANARIAAAIAAFLCLFNFAIFVGSFLIIDKQAFLHVVAVFVPFVLAVSFLLLGYCCFKDFVFNLIIQPLELCEKFLNSVSDFVSSLQKLTAPPPRARQGATC